VRDEQGDERDSLPYELPNAAWQQRPPRQCNDMEACRATSAATSFFDPIAVGRFGEEFVDGATGANNPVREV
jgi:patatin-like phospholipase/acyl hydrolase